MLCPPAASHGTARRQRPDGSNDSFPSGHAATAFATATVLQRHYGCKAGLPAFGMAAYVGGNRLTEDRHYSSDVAFGAAIGVLAGRTTTLHLAGSRFVIAPAVGRMAASVCPSSASRRSRRPTERGLTRFSVQRSRLS